MSIIEQLKKMEIKADSYDSLVRELGELIGKYTLTGDNHILVTPDKSVITFQRIKADFTKAFVACKKYDFGDRRGKGWVHKKELLEQYLSVSKHSSLTKSTNDYSKLQSHQPYTFEETREVRYKFIRRTIIDSQPTQKAVDTGSLRVPKSKRKKPKRRSAKGRSQEYEWGRSNRKPEYWPTKRALVWDCPCGHCNVRWTRQKTSNKHYPMRGECKGCGKVYRNVVRYKKQWLDYRKGAIAMAKAINQTTNKEE